MINHRNRSQKKRKKLNKRKKTYQNRKRKVEKKIRKGNLRKMSLTTSKAIRRRKYLAFS